MSKSETNDEVAGDDGAQAVDDRSAVGMDSEAAVSDDELSRLREELGSSLLTDRGAMGPYLADASRAVPGGWPCAVALVRSTDDVSAALSWANELGIPVSVRGTGTGLSGGAVAYAGGLVISLDGLNRVRSFNPGNRSVEVEAGVITSDVDALAAEHDLMYAPDPASFRTSTIGGNIATNAGGLRCVKYGVTADSVASVEVVLADGTVIDTGTPTRKNAAGLNLTGLMVGSEGVLGVITAARLRLVPRPVGNHRTFRASFSSVADAAATVTAIMSTSLSPEVLELLDRESIAAVELNHPGYASMPGEAVLVGQFIDQEADEALDRLRRLLVAPTGFEVSATDELLEVRRLVSSSLSAKGPRASCDIAVPVDRLGEILTRIEQIGVDNAVSIATFAHAGDGNLHPGITLSDESEAAFAFADLVMDQIADAAQQLGGTTTGEHGVGSLKVHALARQLTPENRALQHRLKDIFDPKGILTPGRAI